METEFIPCVNRNFTKNHLVSRITKRTKCGLKWKKSGKGSVWIPMAVYFNATHNCKICLPRR